MFKCFNQLSITLFYRNADEGIDTVQKLKYDTENNQVFLYEKQKTIFIIEKYNLYKDKLICSSLMHLIDY